MIIWNEKKRKTNQIFQVFRIITTTATTIGNSVKEREREKKTR